MFLQSLGRLKSGVSKVAEAFWTCIRGQARHWPSVVGRCCVFPKSKVFLPPNELRVLVSVFDDTVDGKPMEAMGLQKSRKGIVIFQWFLFVFGIGTASVSAPLAKVHRHQIVLESADIMNPKRCSIGIPWYDVEIGSDVCVEQPMQDFKEQLSVVSPFLSLRRRRFLVHGAVHSTRISGGGSVHFVSFLSEFRSEFCFLLFWSESRFKFGIGYFCGSSKLKNIRSKHIIIFEIIVLSIVYFLVVFSKCCTESVEKGFVYVATSRL